MANEFDVVVRPSRRTLVLSLLGLAAFMALEALLLRHFIANDTRPPAWDQATHLEIALDYREAIGAGRWGDMWYLAPKPGMPPFPPAYHMLLRGAYGSPDPARAALWVNWFYMGVLAVSLFGVAWRFLPDGRALAAVIAFCAAPGLQDLLATQLVDLPLIACVAAAYWALLESDGFTRWLPSLGFGALFAAGMLHKWSFFSYMIGAYAVAGRALMMDRGARLRVLAAAGLSLALFAPWYWSHALLLPSRLMQASSDFATPFYKDWAWAAYLRQSSGDLGPLLWAMGFLSLLAPQYARKSENGWILTYWVLFSYVFWAIVPNRQLRFLLPGLAPLAVALAATWPRAVTWGVALVQLFGAVNYSLGLLGPFTIPTGLAPVTFLENRPPAKEDWKNEEILRRIEADRDPTRAITNVTLVANDTFFNAPTFHWYQRMLNLPHARMRGVNARLCELSEFVLVKDPKLGPNGVISGLPEAAKQIKDPEGWFLDSYDALAKWPLPDNSTAVLYRQKRGRKSPMSRAKVDYAMFGAGMVKVMGLRMDLGVWDRALSAFRYSTVNADSLEVRGLTVRGISAQLNGFSFVPLYGEAGSDYGWNEMRLMRLDKVSVKSLEVGADDLKKFAAARVPGLTLDTVTMDGTIKASGNWKGKPVALEAALELDQAAHRLRVKILSADYMGLALPAALFRPVKELSIALDPNPETPFAIDIPSLTIKGGRLTIP